MSNRISLIILVAIVNIVTLILLWKTPFLVIAAFLLIPIDYAIYVIYSKVNARKIAAKTDTRNQ